MNSTLRTIGQQIDENPRFLWAICLAILFILLVAGLWPFNFHAVNKVTWLKSQNGVHFYGQGIIVGSDIRNQGQTSPFPEKSITLEIWLRPLLETTNLPHILTLHDGKSPELFVVGQWKSHLVIRSRREDQVARTGDKAYREIGLQNGLLKNQDTFITITSGAGGTAVYVNGKRIQSYSNYNMLADVSEKPLRFILGNSSTGESFWVGHLMGLACYNRVLSPAQVLTSHRIWTGKTPVSPDEGCLGMYLFAERKGGTIRNEVASNDPLDIPEVFKPVQRRVLASLREGFRWNVSYLQDIAVNVIGFIPFGFFLSAWLPKNTLRRRLFIISATGKSDHRNQVHSFPESPAPWERSFNFVAVVILGVGLSLAIEVSQAYLPTRDSSLTDVAMNAIGTILGAAIYQAALSYRAGSRPEPGNLFRSS